MPVVLCPRSEIRLRFATGVEGIVVYHGEAGVVERDGGCGAC